MINNILSKINFQYLPIKFYKNFSWQFFSSLVIVITGFLYSIIICKILGIYYFGLLSLAMSFSQLVLRFLEAPVLEASTKYISFFIQEKKIDEMLATIKLSLSIELLMGTVGMIFLLSTISLAPNTLLKNDNAFYVILLAGMAILFANVFSFTSLSFFRVVDDYKTPAIIRIIGQLFNLFGAIFILKNTSYGILGVLYIEILTRFSVTFFLVYKMLSIMKKSGYGSLFQSKIKILNKYYKEMFAFVKNTYFSSLSAIPSRELDINILGYFVSLEVIAAYQIAKRFMQALDVFTDTLFAIIYPEIARLWANKAFSEIQTFIKISYYSILPVTFIIYFSITFSFPLIINILFSNVFNNAIIYFHLMSWSIFLRYPFVWIPCVSWAAGRTDLNLKSAIISGLLTIMLFSLTIPFFGGYASAIIFTMSYPLLLIILFYYIRKEKLIII
jgi:O-antigen/teichoic acid export membrane protein